MATTAENELIDELTNMVDGAIRKQSFSTYDEWQSAIAKVVTSHRVVGKSLLVCRRLPWICGDCGSETVQNLRKHEGDSLIGTCDNCGAEWVS